MKIRKVCAAYFSPTGTTKTITTAIATTLAAKLDVALEHFDFTLPPSRAVPKSFASDTLVVFGTPVYAGRVPNLLLKYLATVQGNAAPAVAVVLFGNRNFDDALIELRDILTEGGFHVAAAGAFIGEHAFSTVLAKDRPDAEDFSKAKQFADDVADKLIGVKNAAEISEIFVDGRPRDLRVYYQPRDRQGNAIDIRKVKPLTADNCDDCKLCVGVCPMGSINPENVKDVSGICIKCGACIKKCPKGAKYYDDPGYLYHKTELEEEYARRAEPKVFL